MKTTVELIQAPNSGSQFLIFEGAANGEVVRLYLDVTDHELLELTSKLRRKVLAKRRSRA